MQAPQRARPRGPSTTVDSRSSTIAQAQPAGIVEIRSEGDPVSKNAPRAAHQENQDAKRDRGEQDGESDAKLRPLQLFLARHGLG